MPDFDEINRNLLREYHSGNEMILGEILSWNNRLVRSIANRYCSNTDNYEDLCQEGMIGMIEAVKRFDPDKGTVFSTYAVWWIRQMILWYTGNTERMIRMPLYQIERIMIIKKENQTRMKQGLPALGIKEISDKFNIPESKAEFLFHAMSRRTISLYSPVREDGEGKATELEDFIPDGGPSVEEIAEENHISRVVSDCLKDTLNAREQDMIMRRYGFFGMPESLESIGESYGISRERVRQIINRALKKIRDNRQELIRETGWENTREQETGG